jgi:hypothetical protein
MSSCGIARQVDGPNSVPARPPTSSIVVNAGELSVMLLLSVPGGSPRRILTDVRLPATKLFKG